MRVVLPRVEVPVMMVVVVVVVVGFAYRLGAIVGWFVTNRPISVIHNSNYRWKKTLIYAQWTSTTYAICLSADEATLFTNGGAWGTSESRQDWIVEMNKRMPGLNQHPNVGTLGSTQG